MTTCVKSLLERGYKILIYQSITGYFAQIVGKDGHTIVWTTPDYQNISNVTKSALLRARVLDTMDKKRKD